jgi:hypothetical protein
MKIRRVFSTPSLAVARAVLDAAKHNGIADNDVSLIARADIELDSIPDERKEVDTDFVPAALRGAGYGGAAGLLAGLAAIVIVPAGITLAGAAIVGVAGALVGTWASALVGSSLPDPIRRKFEDEIAAGRILVVIDGEKPLQDHVLPALEVAGATHLAHEATTAIK